MDTSMTVSQPSRQIILNVEDLSILPSLKRIIKAMNGVSIISQRMARNSGDSITPLMAKKIEKAEKEFAEGKCMECKSHEELESFLNSL